MGMLHHKALHLPHMGHKKMHLPKFPYGLLVFPFTIAIGTIVSLWMIAKLIRDVETMALVDALDEMDTRLSDAEKADLEGRIRERLFA